MPCTLTLHATFGGARIASLCRTTHFRILYLQEILHGTSLHRARSLRGRQQMRIVLQGRQQVCACRVLRRGCHDHIQHMQGVRPASITAAQKMFF